MAAQIFDMEHYERDFDIFLHLKKHKISLKKIWKRFWHDFSLYGGLKLAWEHYEIG